MPHAEFVHLHNHSDYSLLDGASPIPRMIARAVELGMPAVALTDHGALFGAVEFYQEAKKAGIRPILGMEAYVTRGKRQDRTRDTAHHLVLLARDQEGFKNLMRLSSLAFLEGFYYKPRIDHELLDRHSKGLTALSACPKGEVATDLLQDDEEGAFRTASRYREIFGAEHYFLEIQNHGLPIEARIRERIRALARRTGIPVVGTNDCHYLRHEEADAHDVLLCIQTGKSVGDTDRMRYETDQVYFKSPEEMARVFEDFPEALRNTLVVAEQCHLEMSFGAPLLPAFPLPDGVESADSHLRDLTWKGMHERYGEPGQDLRERCAYELDVICRMGFASYFLIVRDFIAFARSRGIGVGPGRGSVAGSIVAYALRITDIDPISHGLIFERFLNPERVTLPDIDIDFDDVRRGEVIEYVKQKYGEDNVTQIITFGTMGAKGVVRDVGRALGLAFAEVDKIARLVPDGLGMTLERALELSPELAQLPERGPVGARLLRSARVLEGLARHASTHAAGVLITPGPLLDYVPLYRQKDDSVTTQWDMKAVEKAGLLKMDFLGLRTLSVFEECRRLIQRHHGIDLDMAALPLDDAAAYRVFQDAETVAIFQFESSGMRDYLRKLKPTVFGDLVAMNALYRPGPMENIPYFIDCKHGRQVVRYEHQALEPILRDTYGVFVYQEQVMAAANALAGFSMAQADELRRAMGKKLPAEMEKKRTQFVEGCKGNQVPARTAEKVFATMERFAGYGFNKCVGGATELFDANTGERTTVEDLFRHRRPFRVHALGDDWKLRPRRVVDVVSNGRKEVFELRTRQGKRIVATANHPFRTFDGWKRLDELAPGDRIAAPRRLAIRTRKTWPGHEIITLAGLLAEGNTCHPTTLYFFGMDSVIVADFAEAIAQFPDTVARLYRRPNGLLEIHANLGRGWRVKENGVTYDATAEEGNLALVLDARRSGAFQWAERLGLLGRKATQKRVPTEVFELQDADIELFIGRLWAGDGFIANHVDHQPFYATSSRGLAGDVQMLLLRLGIISRIKEKQFKYRGELRPGFTVHVYGADGVDVFLERVGPHIMGRQEPLAKLAGYRHRIRAGQSNNDTIPGEVRCLIEQERASRGLSWPDVESRLGSSTQAFRGTAIPGRSLWRPRLARLAVAMDSPRLAAIASSDVVWETIQSIEPRGVQETYDLTVEGDHNFVADGLIVHNSHSAAYALLAYQCAWLKARYPAEFMAATLSSELSDSARVATLIEECRRMGLRLLAPDINRSDWRFTLEEGAIRFGMGAVRNVGAAPVETIVQARQQGGAFTDLFDLAQRVDARTLNRRTLESLIAAGACDALGDRATLFAGAGRALEQAAALHRERESGQSSLFGEATDSAVAVVAPALPPAEPWTARDRSAREKEALGFYLTEHPLEPLRDLLSRIATHPAAEAVQLADGAEVRLVGLPGELKTFVTRAGRTMASVVLEDLSGRIECTIFPDLWDASQPLLRGEDALVLPGRIESRDDRTKLIVSEIKRLEDVEQASRAALHIEVRADELSVPWLESVDQVLSAHPGTHEVYLHIVMPDRSRQASRSRRYTVAQSEALLRALRERFPGMTVRWARRMS